MSRPVFQIEPFFLESPRGALFCLALRPDEMPVRGAILYLHPFAEEMHKSRRMAALQARRMAAMGYLVLQIDLTGCGDSSGDFSDATWDAWLDDAALGCTWLRKQCDAPLSLWGLRTGALLAAEIASKTSELHQLLLWQPVSNGEQFLTQFLRIKLASEMLNEGQAQSGTKALRDQLAAGQAVEVGGNMLAPAMAQAIAARKLVDIKPNCPVTWLDVGAQAGVEIAPAGRRIVELWRSSGVSVTTHTVTGDPFWVTQEITECPALLAQSKQVLSP